MACFNKVRAMEWMRRAGIEALIATSPVNIAYLTQYRNWFAPLFRHYMMNPGDSSAINPGFSVFVPDDDPVLIISAGLAGEAVDLPVGGVNLAGNGFTAQESVKIDPDKFQPELYHQYEIGHVGYASESNALFACLHDHGLDDGTIGIELEGLDCRAVDEIRTLLPRAQIKDCSNLIRLIRMVKTADEIRLLAKAAQWGEEAATEAFSSARPGLDIQEIAQRFRVLVAQKGGDFDHFAFTIGGFMIASNPHYKLLVQDRLFIDYGCLYRGYFSDAGTTLFMSDPTETDLAYFGAVKESIAAGLEKLKPGNRASQVHHAMADIFEKNGINGMFPHGHGMGLDVRDYPILVPNNGLRIKDDCIDLPSDLELEAGMVINLEACAFIRGYGAYQNEQSFVLMETSAEQIVPQDREVPIVAV